MALTDPTLLLAELLGLSPDDVRGAAALAAGGHAYQTWTIPKGDGRQRQISAPCPELKRLQRRLLHRLLYQAPVSPVAHGFVPGRSVVTNARAHLATATSLVSVDLEDAYPSVPQARVAEALEWHLGPFVANRFPPTRHRRPPGRDREAPLAPKGKVERYPGAAREVARLVADVTCHDGSLPQGAPTSGALLNLVCGSLDRQCLRLARRAGLPDLRYTRYADDLTFTSSADKFPRGFEDQVAKAVYRAGFRINRRKVRRTAARHGDLVICGVRLHEGTLTLPRGALRRFRALFEAAARQEPATIPPGLRAKVHGALGLLTMVTPTCPAPLERPLQRVLERHGAWLRPPRRGEYASHAPAPY